MDTTLILDNLLSAPVLAFVLAVALALARFDVRLPEALPPILSAFLLFAIGLKGGRSLSASTPIELVGPLIAAFAIGAVTPVVAFAAMRGVVRLGRADAAGVAAHYGSVSAVTFIVALATVESRGFAAEGVLAGLLAVLEVVGIVVGLALASRRSRDGGWSDALVEIVRGGASRCCFWASPSGPSPVTCVWRRSTRSSSGSSRERSSCSSSRWARSRRSDCGMWHRWVSGSWSQPSSSPS